MGFFRGRIEAKLQDEIPLELRLFAIWRERPNDSQVAVDPVEDEEESEAA